MKRRNEQFSKLLACKSKEIDKNAHINEKNKTITNTHNKCNTSVFRLQPRTFVKIPSEKKTVFCCFFRGLWNTNKYKEKFFYLNICV